MHAKKQKFYDKNITDPAFCHVSRQALSGAGVGPNGM